MAFAQSWTIINDKRYVAIIGSLLILFLSVQVEGRPAPDAAALPIGLPPIPTVTRVQNLEFQLIVSEVEVINITEYHTQQPSETTFQPPPPSQTQVC